MHNFDDLQKRCRVYSMKQNLKYLLGAILILTIAFYFYTHTETKLNNEKNATITYPIKGQLVKKETKKIVVVKEKKPPVVKKKQRKKVATKVSKYSLQFLVASPRFITSIKKKKHYLEMLGFNNCRLQQSKVYIHLICNETDDLAELDSYIKLAKRENIDYVLKTQKNAFTQQKVMTKKKTKVKKTASSIVQVENADTKILQKRFAQTPNYAIALVIARSYYEKGSYKKAIMWAKKANQLDKSDATSWIIYAKSLYALHQNSKARQLLRIYLQYENSDDVKNLLKQWERIQ